MLCGARKERVIFVLSKNLVAALLLVTCAVAPLHAQTTSLKPVSEFKRNDLQEISPDGRLLLFYATDQPVRTFTIPINFSPYNSKTSDDVLRVVERTSGRELGRIRVEFYPEDVQFIPGTQRVLYKEPKPVNSGLEWRLKIWDVESGEARECSDENVIARSFTLLDAQHGLTLFRRVEGDLFSVLSLPGCSQRLIGPIDPANPNAGITGDIALSPDRKQFAYLASDNLIIRNSTTMDVVKNIKPATESYWGRNPIYTPDGKFLLILSTNTIFDKPETKRFLFFYDTTNYELVKRLDVTNWRPPELKVDETRDSKYIGTAMTIGPDSRTIAVAYTRQQAHTFWTTEQAQIVIYDLATGTELARASHPKIRQRRDNPWAASIGKLTFTPDGRQLLSSTNDTLVWAITQKD